MNKWVRNFLYFFVFAGLIAEVIIAAKFGKRRDEVEDQLRTVIADSEKAIATFDTAKREYNTSRSKLTALKNGWGYEWNLPAGGAAGAVQVVGGRLSVTGVGTANGLEFRTVTDGGAQKSVAPVLHLFVDNGQGGSTYIGEFIVPDPGSLTPNSAVLIPTWTPTPEDLQSWNFAGAVRLRSQIPPAGREAVENINQTIVRTVEKYQQTTIRLAEQQRLKDAADLALVKRRNELLGDPDQPDIAEHPEYRVGLVQALLNIEEERNAIQLSVDELRRLIKTAAEQRQQNVDELKEIVSALKDSSTKVSQRSR